MAAIPVAPHRANWERPPVDVRPLGAAGLLIDAVVGWARDRGHSTVELEVAPCNDAALTAYLRSRFTITDREPFTTEGRVLVRAAE